MRTLTLEVVVQVRFSLKEWRIISEKSFGSLELAFSGHYGFSASIHGRSVIQQNKRQKVIAWCSRRGFLWAVHGFSLEVLICSENAEISEFLPAVRRSGI